MARKVMGPTGSRRRRWLFLCTSFAAIAMAVLFIPSAFAVHDLQFQLDGDTTNTAYSPPGTSTPAYDWNDIFNVSTDTTAKTQTVSVNSTNVGSGKTFDAAAFQRDFETNATCPTTSAIGLNASSTNLCTADDTTYATGSKDTLGIGNGGWQCNHDNNVNSKIDIMNAYVLQYTDPGSGDKIFYFGVERNVSNGTNDVGVWFLQSGASCTSPTGSANFTGQHQDGDTLVVAEQTSGGGVSTAKAFRWAASTDSTSKFYGDGGCIDSNDNPNPKTGGCNNLPIATGADCKTAGGGDSLCATTNSFCPPPRKATDPKPPCNFAWNQDVTTPWLTANGSSVGNTIVPPDFFEGGINITKAFAGKTGTTPSCFNTIVPDTRSSASPTATLFDYTLNQLGGCGGSLSTQQNFGSTSQQIGTNGTISSGTDSATLTITGTPSWGGTLTWYLCGPNVTTCDTHGVNVASETVSSTDGGTGADSPKSYSTSDAGITGSSTATLTSAGGTGMYCWHAQFVPNTATKNAGVGNEDDDGASECFTVTPRTPTLSTSATCVDGTGATASPCVLSDTLKDTASLSGTANNPNNDGPGGDTGLYLSINGTTTPATGTISWTAYGPDSCTTVAMAATTRDVSGDNTYPTSSQTAVSFVPSAVGVYKFVATYNGSSPNTNAPSTTATCASPGSNETITVTGSATSSSAQRWLPNDRVVLNSTAGTILKGTLTVTLYKGTHGGTLANCTAGTATAVTGQSYTQSVDQTNETTKNSFTYNTTNTTFVVGTNSDGTTTGAGTDGDYFWLIDFAATGITSPNDRCEIATISHSDS